jgi:hypothetical protein
MIHRRNIKKKASKKNKWIYKQMNNKINKKLNTERMEETENSVI